MSELFGSVTGTRLGEQDAQASMINALAIQEGAQKLQYNQQLNPLLIQQHQLTNQKQQAALDGQRAMAEALKRNESGDPVDPLAAAQKVMEAAFASGNWKAGMDGAKEIEAIKRQRASAGLAAQRQSNEELKSTGIFLDLVGRWAGGVHDEASWQGFIGQVEAQLKRPVPWHNEPYSPERLENIKAQTLKTKEAADLEIKQQEADSRDKNRESAEDFREFRKGILKSEDDIRKRREDRLEKNGGKSSTSPTRTEIEQATALIKGDKPGANDNPTELLTASYAVAARARVLLRDNKALDADEALRRAWDELKGNYTTISHPGIKVGPVTLPFTGSPDEEKFIRGAGSRNEPIDATTGPPAEKERKAGAWYQTPKGLAQWNGKAWLIPGSEKAKAPIPTEPDEIEEDELDEEDR